MTDEGNSQINKRLYLRASFGQGGTIFYGLDPYQGDSQNVSAVLRYQATSKIEARLDHTYAKFIRRSNNERIYDYGITRGKLTYQVNKVLFIRGILFNAATVLERHLRQNRASANQISDVLAPRVVRFGVRLVF